MDQRLLGLLFVVCVAITQPLFAVSSLLSANFEENKGQIKNFAADQGTPNQEFHVFYSLKGSNFDVFFLKNGISFIFWQPDSTYRVDLRYLECSAHCSPIGSNVREMLTRYYTYGTERDVVCRQFGTIVYPNLYPAVDLYCTVQNDQLRLELRGQTAGSDLALQRLCSFGPCTVTASEQLSFSTSSGIPLFTETIQSPLSPSTQSTSRIANPNATPNSEQLTRFTVLPSGYSCAFSIHSNQHTDSVHTASGTSDGLSIASIFDFSTYIGGSSRDSVRCATAGSANSILMCGSTSSQDFPVSSGASQSSLKGARDAFVMSYDASGQRRWATYFGGAGDDAALGCAQSKGTVFLCGLSSSTDIATSGTVQSTFKGGSSDGFVASFSESSGNRIACSYIGGSDFDECRAVSVLTSGDVAIIGSTLSTDLNTTTHQTTLSGAQDAFLAVFNSSLSSSRWSSYYGGRGDEDGSGIASMSDGGLAICGNTSSPNSGFAIAANVGQGSSPPGGLQTSGFLARFDSKGIRTWGRYVGGDAFDTLTCLSTYKDNLIVAGYSNSPAGGANNFISGSSAQSSNGGSQDGFVAKFGSDGLRQWGSFIGGSGNDRCLGLCITPTGYVLACGTTNSPNFPLLQSEQLQNAGGYDTFIGYFLNDGSKMAASIITGGAADEYACGLVYLDDQSILSCGTTSSSNFPTALASQGSNAGEADVFLMKFKPLYVVDVPEIEIIPDMSAFPQPTSGIVTLVFESNELEQSDIRLYSSIGQCVYRTIAEPGISSIELDVRQLKSGMYFAERSTSGRISRCIVIRQ